MKNQNSQLLNFRDMGGLQASDNKKIVGGKLFRTAVLNAKNDVDKAYIDSLNLDCVIDFRSQLEADEKPDYIPTGVEYVSAPVFVSKEHNALAPTKQMLRSMLFADETYINNMRFQMLDSYNYMPYAVSAYSEVFSRMDEGKTISFHCTAGKDRTGICALLIELAFGRNLDQCRHEYLLSNEYHTATVANLEKKLKLLPIKNYVTDFCIFASKTHDVCFDNALNAIFSKYGNINSFFEEVYGVTQSRIDTWKKFYLRDI
ncbi:MAG: tyrosine-protein phosphatase [Clostridia bacterium]